MIEICLLKQRMKTKELDMTHTSLVFCNAGGPTWGESYEVCPIIFKELSMDRFRFVVEAKGSSVRFLSACFSS